MSGEDSHQTSTGTPSDPTKGTEQPKARAPLWRSKRLLRAWSLSKDFLSVKNVVLALMLIVIVVVGFTRGWDDALAEVEKEATPGAFGEQIEAGPFSLVIEGVTMDSTCLESTADLPLCLNVRFQGTNTTDRVIEDSAFATHLLDSGMLTVTENDQPLPGPIPYPRIVRAIDGLTQGAFQPGIAGDYTAVWAVSADIDRCDLAVVIKQASWVKSSLDGHRYWRLDDPLTTIPVCGGE